MAALKSAAEQIQGIEEKLSDLFENLDRVGDAGATSEASSEVTSLKAVNTKLKYRIEHLKKSIADEEAKRSKYMTNVQAVVTALFRTAIAQSYPMYSKTKTIVTPSTAERFGDYKCIAAMPISQFLKQSGTNVSPHTVASTILDHLPSAPVIEKCEVAGPGFVNVWLNKSFVTDTIYDIIANGIRPPPISRKLRVIVDFSSPNVAKEMHVGHLRSTIIGETLCRLLEFAGHDVLRLNHIGDWGTQFGMLIAHLKESYPDYKTAVPSISQLMTLYKESKIRFDKDEEFKKRAYNEVVKLQNGDPEAKGAWELVCAVSRKENDLTYQHLGVTIIERGESFYQPLMCPVVEDLENKGLVQVEEGRKVLYVEGQSVPLTIVKSDGAFTYDTSDMAAIRHRAEEEKGDWLIYVVDSGQSMHFETIFGAARMAGYVSDDVRVDHTGFGVVLGEDKKKFKTRTGDSVRLRDLLDEGLERSLNRLKEKGRDKVLTPEELKQAQESVAYGCIKYADLSHTRTNDYEFSFDKMLEDRGNTAVYLLYAYTRIRSIIRLSGVSEKQLSTPADIDLSHPKEFKLAKCIIRFSEVLSKILDDLFPHTLCEYLYELCTIMTEFYDACYCVEKDRATGKVINVNISRILLLEATRLVLKQSFDIIGIDPVEKM